MYLFPTRHPRRSRIKLASVCAFLAIFAGCAAERPSIDTPADIARATGGAISFQANGGQLDAPSDPATSGTLTNAEALQRAISTSPEIQAALARVRIAMADSDQSRLLANPVLSVLFWFDVSGGPPQLEISIAQEIIQLLSIPHASSAADNRLRAASADALTAALDVAENIQQTYARAQSSDRLVPMVQDRLALFDRSHQLATAKLAIGEGTRADVTVLEAQRLQIQVELDVAKLQNREACLHLARAIGEPSSAASWTLDGWTPPPDAIKDESAWIAGALANRPELQSLTWQLAALGDDAAVAALSPWNGAGVGADAQKDPDWIVGPNITVPIPIFDTGAAAKARVAAQQAEARHHLTFAKRQAVEEVRVAYQNLKGTLANLHLVNDELVPLQQRRHHEAEVAFRAGHTDATPLYLAQQDLLAAQTRAIEMESQATAAFIQLERAAGGAGPAASIRLSQITPHTKGPSQSAQQENTR